MKLKKATDAVRQLCLRKLKIDEANDLSETQITNLPNIGAAVRPARSARKSDDRWSSATHPFTATTCSPLYSTKDETKWGRWSLRGRTKSEKTSGRGWEFRFRESRATVGSDVRETRFRNR